jgi:predicted aspartyl protease
MKRTVLMFTAVMLLVLAAFAEEPKKEVAAPPPPSPIRELLNKDRYQEALTAAEAALQADPSSLDNQVYRIEALMGLDREMEALRLVVPLAGQHPERPDLRYRVGQCASALGMFPQAIGAWTALYSCPDKDWAGLAVRQSARTLAIQGKELEARKLVNDMLAKWETPPAVLLRYALETDPSVAEGLKRADQAMVLDSKNKAEYESLKAIFAAAGEGELFQEAPQTGPITFKLKEKSETRHMTSFAWGSSDMDSTAEITMSSRVVVPVALNGTKERPMLLDSGSDTVLVTADVVKELGLKTVSTTSYIGIGYEGVKNSSWVLIKSLVLGSLTLKNVPAMVIEENNDFWKETGGLLPLSLFSAHGVLYDRRGGKVVLYPSGTKPEEVLPGGSFSVKSLWYANKPHVEVKVQERAGLNFLVDTGAWTTFIAGQYAQEMGVRVNRAAETKHSSGLSGSALSGQANDVTVWLGPARFKLSPCQVMEIFEEGGARRYGILGRNVLDQFSIYFDYRSNVVAFKAYDR